MRWRNEKVELTELHVRRWKEGLSDDSFWLENLGGWWCNILRLGRCGLERVKSSVGLSKLTCTLNIQVELFRRQVNKWVWSSGEKISDGYKNRGVIRLQMLSFYNQGTVWDHLGSKRDRAKKGLQEKALGHLNSYMPGQEEDKGETKGGIRNTRPAWHLTNLRRKEAFLGGRVVNWVKSSLEVDCFILSLYSLWKRDF